MLLDPASRTLKTARRATGESQLNADKCSTGFSLLDVMFSLVILCLVAGFCLSEAHRLNILWQRLAKEYEQQDLAL